MVFFYTGVSACNGGTMAPIRRSPNALFYKGEANGYNMCFSIMGWPLLLKGCWNLSHALLQPRFLCFSGGEGFSLSCGVW